MPEKRKRGFHALEQRIHEIEDEDRKRDEAAAAGAGTPRATAPPGVALPRPDDPTGRKAKEG